MFTSIDTPDEFTQYSDSLQLPHRKQFSTSALWAIWKFDKDNFGRKDVPAIFYLDTWQEISLEDFLSMVELDPDFTIVLEALKNEWNHREQQNMDFAEWKNEIKKNPTLARQFISLTNEILGLAEEVILLDDINKILMGQWPDLTKEYIPDV